MAGVSGANPNQQLAQLLATSNTTLDRLNQKFDFVAHYKMKDPKVRRGKKSYFEQSLRKNGRKIKYLYHSFTDKDPVFAKQVVDEAVAILSERFAQLSGNQAMQQKALLEKRPC